MRNILPGFAMLGLGVAGVAWAQTMTEFGAAAAGATVGGAAGKKVSDGITAVFGKVDEQTKAAAKQAPPKGETAKEKAVPADTASNAAAAPASSDPVPAPAIGPAPKTAPKSATKPAARPVAKAAPKPESPPEPPLSAPAPGRTTGTTPRAVLNSVPDPPPLAIRTAAGKPAQPPVSKPEGEVAPILPPPPPREATAEDLLGLTPGTIREDVLKLGPPASRITMFDEGHLLEIYSYATRNTTFGVVRLSDGAVSRVELR